MGKVTFKTREDNIKRKVDETLQNTVIHQRQRELAIGRWDFVVFGPSPDKKHTVLRVCAAEHLIVQEAAIYMASIGNPESVGMHGIMSIEELTGGDVSDELKGLEVYHVSPLRPIEVFSKQEGADIDRMRDKALEEFEDKNIAIIETPDESAWSLSALKYLNECDEMLPDPAISAIRSRMRDTSLDFGRRSNLLS